MVTKRRIQKGDRHKLRPTAIRISPELKEKLRIRAAQETTILGHSVSMNDLFEVAALELLDTPLGTILKK